jgi:hypothetical protein
MKTRRYVVRLKRTGWYTATFKNKRIDLSIGQGNLLDNLKVEIGDTVIFSRRPFSGATVLRRIAELSASYRARSGYEIGVCYFWWSKLFGEIGYSEKLYLKRVAKRRSK